MQTIDKHGTFEAAIGKSSDAVQALARRLRQLIIEVYPNVVEVPWPKQGIVGYGVGPKKQTEHFCYIGAYKNHINLGFNYGADLTDSENLLVGTGKKFRHVKISHVEDAKRPSLKQLIETAVREREATLGHKPSS